jgi:hypothetical protein
MGGSRFTRAWTSDWDGLAERLRGCGCEPSHRGVLGRVEISANIDAPCVLALLGSRRPGHHVNQEPTI